jgi:hypothetical protein
MFAPADPSALTAQRQRRLLGAASALADLSELGGPTVDPNADLLDWHDAHLREQRRLSGAPPSRYYRVIRPIRGGIVISTAAMLASRLALGTFRSRLARNFLAPLYAGLRRAWLGDAASTELAILDEVRATGQYVSPSAAPRGAANNLFMTPDLVVANKAMRRNSTVSEAVSRAAQKNREAYKKLRLARQSELERTLRKDLEVEDVAQVRKPPDEKDHASHDREINQ